MTNFNFKRDWEQICMPVIRTNRIYGAMKQGIKRYMDVRISELGEEVLDAFDLEHIAKPFKRNDYPLRHARGDSICDEEEKIEDRVITFLKEKGILKDDVNEPDSDSAWEDYQDTSLKAQYDKYKQTVIEPYLDVERMRNYKYFCLYGGCHWYNPTFGITLAKMVMPDIKWKIISGEFHTTVVSHDEKLVFDILYFDEKDTETYGGRHAIVEAKREEEPFCFPEQLKINSAKVKVISQS